jgi:uncharacterized membrane protein YqjE
MGHFMPTRDPGGTQQGETTPPNGKPSPGLLKDHLDLALLEWGYEKQEGWRRLLCLGVGALFLFSSFVYLQVAVIGWLLRMGLRWEGIGFLLGAFYFASGISVIWFLGRRQKGLGPAFQGSITELKRSLRWIENHFS